MALDDLKGTGWHAAEVEAIDEQLPLERYTVDDTEFVAGPADDRPGRDDHGDGKHLTTESEGSSTVQTFAVGSLLVDVERDSQPDATSPRLRVRPRRE